MSRSITARRHPAPSPSACTASPPPSPHASSQLGLNPGARRVLRYVRVNAASPGEADRVDRGGREVGRNEPPRLTRPSSRWRSTRRAEARDIPYLLAGLSAAGQFDWISTCWRGSPRPRVPRRLPAARAPTITHLSSTGPLRDRDAALSERLENQDLSLAATPDPFGRAHHVSSTRPPR